MGWFFKKKKSSTPVPQPNRALSEEHALNLSQKKNEPEKVIRPAELKAAAGVGPKAMAAPEPEGQMPEMPTNLPAAQVPSSMPGTVKQPMRFSNDPIYLPVASYRKILGELDEIKYGLARLGELNKNLEKSEYNEEKDFNKMRLAVKNVHDKLLNADDILFKN
jgi:hypothetical protein